MQCSRTQTDQNTAEYTHLQGLDTNNAGSRAAQVRCTEGGQHRTNGSVHDEEGNRRHPPEHCLCVPKLQLVFE